MPDWTNPIADIELAIAELGAFNKAFPGELARGLDQVADAVQSGGVLASMLNPEQMTTAQGLSAMAYAARGKWREAAVEGLGAATGEALEYVLSGEALGAISRTGGAAGKLAFKTGAEGEAYLAEMFPGGLPQVKFQTEIGTGAQRTRYIDWLVDGIAHESKVGYTKLGDFQKKQIAKDAWLLINRPKDVKEIVWHFFRSAETGEIGATQEVLQALENNGIKYVIHH